MGKPLVGLRVILDLEPTPDSIRGSVAVDDTSPHQFQGWLELSALLDRIRPRLPGAVEQPADDTRG